MSKSRARSLLALVLVCSLIGCTRLSPAGFWTTYRSDLIVKKYSDQGPWGGVRWVHWQAPANGAFVMQDVIRFARSKGWSCEVPVAYSAAQLSLWRYGGKPVFPLHFGAPDSLPADASVADFPRAIEVDSIVSRCDSGWIRVDAGSDKSYSAYGYIQMDKSGTRLAVYHLWGEI